MKSFLNSLTLFCLAGLLAGVSGCASTQKTENMLSAAGFRTQIASTPQQEAHLATLPADKLIPVKRNGVVYFVFADKAHNQILIGQQAQYTAYEQMLQADQQAKEDAALSRWDAETAQMNEAASAWDNWGVWQTYPIYP